MRDLSRSRYGRNRNRFITVPRDLDCNAGNATLLNAALAAGLFPKILAVESGGQMRTITNNQQASFHPSSVNFGRKPRDMGTHHLAYFTLMQSRKLYAWETGPVDDLALILLCGEADTKVSVCRLDESSSNLLSSYPTLYSSTATRSSIEFHPRVTLHSSTFGHSSRPC